MAGRVFGAGRGPKFSRSREFLGDCPLNLQGKGRQVIIDLSTEEQIRAYVDEKIKSSSFSKETIDEAFAITEKYHEVLVDGRPCHLTVKEFELLEYLLVNINIVLKREQIMEGGEYSAALWTMALLLFLLSFLFIFVIHRINRASQLKRRA